MTLHDSVIVASIVANVASMNILDYVTRFGSIGIREAEAILPEMNRRTIQRRPKRLIEAGYLELVGETHDAKYVMRG